LCGLSLPTFARLLLNDPLAALATLTAIASIACWGLCVGALCRNARPFELLMVGTVYACLNGATVMDTAGHPLFTLTLHASALLPATLLLIWAWPRFARS
jgi:hypothetical protein